MLDQSQELNAENEWAFLNTELFENKPAVAPYPEKVVRARGILLRLQVLLSAYEYETDLDIKAEFEKKYLQSRHAYLQLAYQNRTFAQMSF